MAGMSLSTGLISGMDTGTLISQSRDGPRTARESLRLNPHPWARRRRGTLTFEAYDRTMEALVRMISQVTAITRSIAPGILTIARCQTNAEATAGTKPEARPATNMAARTIGNVCQKSKAV